MRHSTCEWRSRWSTSEDRWTGGYRRCRHCSPHLFTLQFEILHPPAPPSSFLSIRLCAAEVTSPNGSLQRSSPLYILSSEKPVSSFFYSSLISYPLPRVPLYLPTAQLRLEKFSARWFELKPKKLDIRKEGEMEQAAASPSCRQGGGVGEVSRGRRGRERMVGRWLSVIVTDRVRDLGEGYDLS